jgi:hypothetical protein
LGEGRGASRDGKDDKEPFLSPPVKEDKRSPSAAWTKKFRSQVQLGNEALNLGGEKGKRQKGLESGKNLTGYGAWLNMRDRNDGGYI